MKTSRLIGFLVALAASLQITLRAADVTATWTNAASGSWNANANWKNVTLLGGFPNNGNGGVATYDAVISATGAAYTVTNAASITVEDLAISSANATLNHTAGIFTATNGGILTVNSAAWSNASTVRALTGGTVNLNGAWSNLTGTLTADATSVHLKADSPRPLHQ